FAAGYGRTMNLFTPPIEIVREKKVSAPQVTVIVTQYNYGHYLDACLDSIRAQTQDNLELVIVDDHSPDGGLGIATRWLARNDDVFAGYRLIHHTKNMGLAYARNTAFAHASAPYVFVVDA